VPFPTRTHLNAICLPLEILHCFPSRTFHVINNQSQLGVWRAATKYRPKKNKSSFTLDQALLRTDDAFKKNNFGILDALHSSIGEGEGVYPCAALLNHSCAPNAILRYKLDSGDNGGKEERSTIQLPSTLFARWWHCCLDSNNNDWEIGMKACEWAESVRASRHRQQGIGRQAATILLVDGLSAWCHRVHHSSLSKALKGNRREEFQLKAYAATVGFPSAKQNSPRRQC